MVMNKYILLSGVSSPNKTPYSQTIKHTQLQIDNYSTPQIGRQTIQPSPNYLETQIPSVASLSASYHKNYNYPLAGKKAQLSLQQEKKMCLWKQKKRLIIVEDSDVEVRKNSLSITLEKRKAEHSETKKIKSFSSQKKTMIKESFQVCNPPKRVSKAQKARDNDSKCEMIKNIMQKFKKQVSKELQTEECESPCISSLKLKDRIVQQANPHARQNQHLKFLGKRGCPLNKASKNYIERREKRQHKPSLIVAQKLHPEEISPWHTEQF